MIDPMISILEVIRENQANGFYDKPAPNDTAVADDEHSDPNPEPPDDRPDDQHPRSHS